jgi:hypothetical protein
MAGNNLEELEKIYKSFKEKVSLDWDAVERHNFRLAEFLNVQGDVWKHYSGWAGVYYLYSDDGFVHYVGEGTTLEWGVGYRVRENATKGGLIQQPAMNVGCIFFGKSDLPFALALERFLIIGLCPPCNKLA